MRSFLTTGKPISTVERRRSIDDVLKARIAAGAVGAPGSLKAPVGGFESVKVDQGGHGTEDIGSRLSPYGEATPNGTGSDLADGYLDCGCLRSAGLGRIPPASSNPERIKKHETRATWPSLGLTRQFESSGKAGRRPDIASCCTASHGAVASTRASEVA